MFMAKRKEENEKSPALPQGGHSATFWGECSGANALRTRMEAEVCRRFPPARPRPVARRQFPQFTSQSKSETSPQRKGTVGHKSYQCGLLNE